MKHFLALKGAWAESHVTPGFELRDYTPKTRLFVWAFFCRACWNPSVVEKPKVPYTIPRELVLTISARVGSASDTREGF
jgi:hypothetical protein